MSAEDFQLPHQHMTHPQGFSRYVKIGNKVMNSRQITSLWGHLHWSRVKCGNNMDQLNAYKELSKTGGRIWKFYDSVLHDHESAYLTISPLAVFVFC